LIAPCALNIFTKEARILPFGKKINIAKYTQKLLNEKRKNEYEEI
jgi:hypothetical protein